MKPSFLDSIQLKISLGSKPIDAEALIEDVFPSGLPSVFANVPSLKDELIEALSSFASNLEALLFLLDLKVKYDYKPENADR